MKVSIKTIVTVGMFTAVLSVLSILTIPMPSGVPVTLQTFAMALCGYVMGWRRGACSTLLYLLIGAVGVPVFAGMSGGPAVLFSYSGGFLWGFIFLALLCGVGAAQKNAVSGMALGIVGLAVCHLFGAVQFAIVASTPPVAAFLTASAPYLLKDVISVIGAYFAAVPIRRALRAGNILTEGTRGSVTQQSGR